MDVKHNHLALKKKRELLAGLNKRKMSLRRPMDLKQNECRLDITQITKCVFLGSLCLKPVPQLFDSPLLLEELDMTVGNVRSDISINIENEITPRTSNGLIDTALQEARKGRRKCLNIPKIRKKSFRDRNEPRMINGFDKVIKNENISIDIEQVEDELEITLISSESSCNEVPSPEPMFQKMEPRDSCTVNDIQTIPVIDDNEIPSPETIFPQNNELPSPETIFPQNNESPSPETIFPQNNNIKQPRYLDIEEISTSDLLDELPYDFIEEIPLEEDPLDLKLNHSRSSISSHSITEEVPPDIKSISLHYEDVERLKREPTPELILSDSDEDAIDQLMYNIMDIKVGPHVFQKEFFDTSTSSPEEYEEYPNEYNNVREEFPNESDNNDSKEAARKSFKRTPQCKICSQVFSSYLQLKNHKEAHDGDKPYLCLKCKENHTTLDQLIAHLRTHQGKRPYVCKKCNKGFKTTKALDKHKPVHVLKKAVPQKKAFHCEVCGKEFRKLCDLERHTRVHTGEKPSVCNICNRRFQQAHNLNKHLLIHTKEKPFECDICSKKFGRNDVLNRHLLTHSVKKPNLCDVCRKSFIRVSQLMAHKEKYHSNAS